MGSESKPVEYTITVTNNNLLETLKYVGFIYFGCASGFPVGNSLCAPVKYLPQGAYNSACAYNISSAVKTAVNGCNCGTAQSNFLGCWDKSGLTAPPAACQTNVSSNVADCSDCSASCPQPQ